MYYCLVVRLIFNSKTYNTFVPIIRGCKVKKYEHKTKRKRPRECLIDYNQTLASLCFKVWREMQQVVDIRYTDKKRKTEWDRRRSLACIITIVIAIQFFRMQVVLSLSWASVSTGPRPTDWLGNMCRRHFTIVPIHLGCLRLPDWDALIESFDALSYNFVFLQVC